MQPHSALYAMTASLVTPRCLLLLLLTVAGGSWCQTLLLDPEPRPCRTQDNATARAVLSQGRRNEYPAGGVLMLLAKMPAGLFGSLQVFLCPDSDAEVECEDRVPLELADGSGTSYSLQKVPRTDRYEIPVILPDDITCPACTLQVRVLTRDCADEEVVEAPCPEKEVTFCSDITIRDINPPSLLPERPRRPLHYLTLLHELPVLLLLLLLLLLQLPVSGTREESGRTTWMFEGKKRTNLHDT
ncbi:uncharacterized protein LOC135111691 isoform X1 [Scylla paramamosain]|uniref:uncharacterized protein LOC135111691 isoform X1 n=1 Tax=Scylla paramamosain TaxID=85552 RepID=UPI003082F2A3